MNEQIKELWNKAAESTAAHPSGQNNSWETQVNFLDKFAQLIVKECMTICEDVTERNDPAIACYYEIKKHFGVES